MTLEEFIKTDVYKDAGYYNYVDSHKQYLEIQDDDDLLNKIVLDYYQYSDGCLQIRLDI